MTVATTLNVTDRRVTGAGVELAVRETGERDRPTVLLVHGYPDTGAVWDEVVAELEGRFHVVVTTCAAPAPRPRRRARATTRSASCSTTWRR